jgi:hypothetical protein
VIEQTPEPSPKYKSRTITLREAIDIVGSFADIKEMVHDGTIDPGTGKYITEDEIDSEVQEGYSDKERASRTLTLEHWNYDLEKESYNFYIPLYGTSYALFYDVRLDRQQVENAIAPKTGTDSRSNAGRRSLRQGFWEEFYSEMAARVHWDGMPDKDVELSQHMRLWCRRRPQLDTELEPDERTIRGKVAAFLKVIRAAAPQDSKPVRAAR